MKYLKYIFLISIIYSCQSKDCSKWYTGIKLAPVTSVNNGNEMIGDWYTTYFLNNELNLATTLYYSKDGYGFGVCETITWIHEIIEDSIFISCGNYLIINNDTIKAHENLKKYFKQLETDGRLLYEYNKQENGFPRFEQSENTFYIEVLLTDNTVLKDSCVVKIIQ